MSYTKQIFLVLLSLIFIGAGCLPGGTKTNADGGIFWTEDAGASFTQSAILPTVQGLSTISGVNVTSIEVDPSDHEALYIGTEANGMFYSLDNGGSWMRPKGAQARDGHVIDVEIDPNDVCTSYVLKPDRILKTTDCNRTYSALTIESRTDEQFTTFVLDWFNPKVLWAGNTAGDVMKSIDSGLSWTTVYRVRDGITSVEVSNADSRIILVGTEDKGLHRSIDSGYNWIEFEDVLNKSYRDSDRVFGLAQSRDGNMLVMNTAYGLLASSDRGETWEALPLRHAPNSVRIWSVAVHPSENDVISYATDGALFVSTNAGGSWASEDLPSNRSPKALLVHPSNTSRLMVGFSVDKD